MTIHYKIGDACNPPSEISGPKLLLHICNDCRAWGAGFVLALSKKWEEPERRYRTNPDCCLGDIQLVQVEKDLFVINMIAQILGWENGPPIRYQALDECLTKVYHIAKAMNAKIIAPRFGAGLAGGDWAKIETIIEDRLSDLDVFVFDLPKR